MAKRKSEVTEQIADDYETRGDTDTHLQRGRRARIEIGHGFDQGEARAGPKWSPNYPVF